MKNKTIATLCVLSAIAAATACQSAGNANSNKPANNAAQPNATKETAVMTPVSTDPAPRSAGSPIDTYKAAYAARKNKDVDALRKLMSKEIMEFFTEIGKEEKKTPDDMLKELCEKPQAKTDDARNEKIDGDRATIEYLDENGKWKTMDFIKEGGGWKLTLPKMDEPAPVSKDENKDKKAGGKDDK